MYSISFVTDWPVRLLGETWTNLDYDTLVCMETLKSEISSSCVLRHFKICLFWLLWMGTGKTMSLPVHQIINKWFNLCLSLFFLVKWLLSIHAS